jgi:hypothetical protein
LYFNFDLVRLGEIKVLFKLGVVCVFVMGEFDPVAWGFFILGVVLAASGFLLGSFMSATNSLNLLIAGAVFCGLGLVVGIGGALISECRRG